MVTIIGGGIAGSALAGALARRDRSVSVYEQQPNGGGGAFLFIDGRGHDALTGLGVDRDRLHEASSAVVELTYADNTGRASQIRGRGHRFWQRPALMSILTGFATDSGAQLHYCHPITQIAVAGPAITLHCLLDTIGVEDDLVVGADGIDSVVRAGIEPNRVPQYAGEVVLYGETTAPVALDSAPAMLHFFAEIDTHGASASTFGHIWRPNDPSAYWFLRIARPALDDAIDMGRKPADDWADIVLAAAPSVHKIASNLLEHTNIVHVSNARNVPLDTAADPALPILLVGDADHAISPAAGVGARESLEDIQAVCQAVTGATSPAAAMTARRNQISTERSRTLRSQSGRSV